jgi:hypothetical protein
LSFSDKVRNGVTEGSGLDSTGTQKHEFPYLARIPGAELSAGKYVARVTVRQNDRTITRSVPFQVK